jgi:ABC-type transport system substrate-binding protein
VKLLNDAGWKDRDAQGRLTKNGQPLTMELLYFYKPYEGALTTYQEELRKVGIGLNLRFVTPETLYSLVPQRKFELAMVIYGGLVFPQSRDVVLVVARRPVEQQQHHRVQEQAR